MYTVKKRLLKYKCFNGFIAYDVYKDGCLYVSAMSPRLIEKFFNINVEG